MKHIFTSTKKQNIFYKVFTYRGSILNNEKWLLIFKSYDNMKGNLLENKERVLIAFFVLLISLKRTV